MGVLNTPRKKLIRINNIMKAKIRSKVPSSRDKNFSDASIIRNIVKREKASITNRSCFNPDFLYDLYDRIAKVIDKLL